MYLFDSCILSCIADGFPSLVSGSLLFSWCLTDCTQVQTAYRLVISHDATTVWDSQRQETAASAGILYDGEALLPDTDYTAEVFVETADGSTLASQKLLFTTALSQKEPWPADWLCSAFCHAAWTSPLFRKVLSLPALPRRARLFICGLGYCEAYLNGQKLGDDLLSPARTCYDKRVNYVAYDALPLLVPGENILGVMLGAGWYSSADAIPRPAFTAQLRCEYADGSVCVFATHPQTGWFCYDTPPMERANLYIGEVYNENLIDPDWCRAAYMPDEAHWRPALEAEPPKGLLLPMAAEPIRVVGSKAPVLITQIKPDTCIVDFGQNLTGIVSLQLRGLSKNHRISIRYSELLHKDGTLNTANLRTAQQQDVFISRGGDSTYQSRFTYHGFRYAEVSGLPCKLQPEDITARLLRSDVPSIGSFSCSNNLLTKLETVCRWTESNNLHSIPTDCPQRDERLGWMNDLTVRYEEAMYHFDLRLFFRKFVQDILDAQGEKTGAISDTVPLAVFGSQPADPVCSSFLLLPTALYTHFADMPLLQKAYPGMKAWTDYLSRQRTDGIVCYSYYGDWAAPIGGTDADSIGNGAVSQITPGKLISTGYFYLNCRLMAKAAAALSLSADVRRYETLMEETRAAVNRAYFHADDGYYAKNSQASNTFMLYLGLVPEEKKSAVLQHLVADIRANDTHLTTGNLCSKYILEVLAENGELELAYSLLTQTTYPSWGYMLQMGATTVWERWEYVDDGPLIGMASHNHPMYASVSAWFYKYLLGIRPECPGFSRFTLQPYFPEKLESACGTFETVKGRIAVSWKQSHGTVTLDITVPAGSTAILRKTKPLSACTVNGIRQETPMDDFVLAGGHHQICMESLV